MRRIQTATERARTDPDPDQSIGAIYNTTRMLNLSKLVMEMCKPLFVSNQMVNMDMFYTSPHIMILL
jgi:hypothetical protein